MLIVFSPSLEEDDVFNGWPLRARSFAAVVLAWELVFTVLLVLIFLKSNFFAIFFVVVITNQT